MKREYKTTLVTEANRRPHDWTGSNEIILQSFLLALDGLDLKYNLDYDEVNLDTILNDYDFIARYLHHLEHVIESLKLIGVNKLYQEDESQPDKHEVLTGRDIKTTLYEYNSVVLNAKYKKELDKIEEKRKIREQAEAKAKKELMDYQNSLLKKEAQKEAELEASIRLPYAD